nr:MAG TPA: hypothetical protein [Caudoviricetes sp.]
MILVRIDEMKSIIPLQTRMERLFDADTISAEVW